MLALLTLLGTILGAALGGFTTIDNIEEICRESISAQLEDYDDINLEVCAYVASRTVAFSCDIVAMVLVFICVIVIAVCFFKEELLRPCKILVRVMFTISTIFLIIALIPGPALVSDYFSVSFSPVVEQYLEYTGWLDALNPETMRQQWYSSLIAAVLSLATMLTSCICPP